MRLSCGILEDCNTEKKMFVMNAGLWDFKKKVLKDSITGVCWYFELKTYSFWSAGADKFSLINKNQDHWSETSALLRQLMPVFCDWKTSVIIRSPETTRWNLLQLFLQYHHQKLCSIESKVASQPGSKIWQMPYNISQAVLILKAWDSWRAAEAWCCVPGWGIPEERAERMLLCCSAGPGFKVSWRVVEACVALCALYAFPILMTFNFLFFVCIGRRQELSVERTDDKIPM